MWSRASTFRSTRSAAAGQRPSPWGNSSARVRSYTVGTLVVDMFDAKSKRAVWRGTASGAIPKTSDKATAKTQEPIDRMVASFPGAAAKR